MQSQAGWRTEMAKWIGDMRAEDEVSDSESDDEEQASNTPRIPTQASTRKWPKYTLHTLFNGLPKPPRAAAAVTRARAAAAFNEDAELMEALANLEEDEIPDDGDLVGSGDDYEG
jgi:hypothetical protein